MPPLAASTGKAYWRSLGDLAESDELRALVEREFPSQLEAIVDPISRRRFVQLMGASLAMAGLTGCDLIRWPKEKILPFVQRPEGRHPGTPVQYATAFELQGVAEPLLVTSYDGRPVKVEGNDRHPASGGASSSFAQASVLSLYDPDRSRGVRQRAGEGSKESSWEELHRMLAPRFAERVRKGDKRLAILCEATSSVTVAALRRQIEEQCPDVWHEWEPLSRDNEWSEVAGEVLGGRISEATRCLEPVYRTHLDLERADVVLCLDACLFGQHPDALRLSRGFADRRRRFDADRSCNRLYAVESTLSLTGGMADDRLALAPSEILYFGLRLAHEIAADPRMEGKVGAQLKQELSRFNRPGFAHQALVGKIARDLVQARGQGVVAVGPRQSPTLHALGHLLNGLLGNVATAAGEVAPVRYTAQPSRPSHLKALVGGPKDLWGRIQAGDVDTLVILGGNPVLDAPIEFKNAILGRRDLVSVHLSPYFDETSRAATWHAPRAHYLEAWGDARAYDGTLSVVQPLIRPLFGGKTPIELLKMVLGVDKHEDAQGYLLVREAMKAHLQGDFEAGWRRALHDGFVAGSAPRTAAVQRDDAKLLEALKKTDERPRQATKTSLELVLTPCPKLHDGRFANNAWLQELPDPFTKLTWDNALLMSPETAQELGGVTEGALVSVSVKAAGKASEVKAPAYLLPGLPKLTLNLALGWGRGEAAGVVAAGGKGDKERDVGGVNAYPLRSPEAMDLLQGVTPTLTGARWELATTQDHHSIRTELGDKETARRAGELVREATVGQLKQAPKLAKNAWEGGKFGVGPDPRKSNLWQEPIKYDGHRWGMSIDLAACTGCGACVVACQAENNIPVVGKSEVARGREMHWLRIDRYFSTAPIGPAVEAKQDAHAAAKPAAHLGGDKAQPVEQALRVVHQPMPCQQCENAPCESVCPVAATTHTQEGLNDMAYNRCIGTRYCANNCPYKVRRFNFFWNHHGPFHPRSKPGAATLPKLPDNRLTRALPGVTTTTPLTQVEQMVWNPEVTVRARGVMEKCTYCVQRIKAATIPLGNLKGQISGGKDEKGRDSDQAKAKDAAIQAQMKLKDGAVQTACQQACPTRAIVFGDLADKTSEVARLEASDRSYTILSEINTRPRTHYLARVKNPVDMQAHS